MIFSRFQESSLALMNFKDGPGTCEEIYFVMILKNSNGPKTLCLKCEANLNTKMLILVSFI